MNDVRRWFTYMEWEYGELSTRWVKLKNWQRHYSGVNWFRRIYQTSACQFSQRPRILFFLEIDARNWRPQKLRSGPCVSSDLSLNKSAIVIRLGAHSTQQTYIL